MMILAGGVGRVKYTYTFSGNAQQALVGPGNVPGYVAGKTDLTIVVNSGVYVYSDTTNVPGLTIGAFSVGDTVKIINNGYIIGKGGNAPTATYSGSTTGIAGNPGGPAMALNFPVTIDNTNSSAYIAGGGGSGASACYGDSLAGGGGGAGGGNGGGCVGNGITRVVTTQGGAPGTSGSDSYSYNSVGQFKGGGGGGRILPGVGGITVTGSSSSPAVTYGRGGGAGGSGAYSQNGATGQPYGSISAGGGGWGAAGGTSYYYYGYPNVNYVPQYGGGGSNNQPGVPPNLSRPYLAGYVGASGGIGGKAIDLQGNSVTWVSGDTTRVWGNVI